VELLAATVRTTGMTPDRLVGIYLVGGSSRIPLVATLIAEQLRVVPTSLDQPETAVALGAHHVPQEGISMRTQEVASALAEDQPTTTMTPVRAGAYRGAPPQSGGFPAQQSFPQTGPQPVRPPLPANFPVTASTPVPEKKKNRKLPMVIGALVVIALAAAGAFFLLPSGSDLPTAQDCQSTADKDDKGFTKCLRQLAGGVPDTSTCKDGQGSSGLDENVGVITTCVLQDDYQVTYLQASSATVATQEADKVLGALGGERVKADWKGNGLTGKYQAAISSGTGKLVFTVEDRPIVGVLSKVQLRDTSYTPGAIADFFEKSVQPGT
jgi:hypothetical protein